MKLHYFGTAAAEGIPAVFCNCSICKQAMALGEKNLRTRSQVLLNDTLLLDFPPDSHTHMLTGKLWLPDIQHLLITHSHQDHFYPEELLLRANGYATNEEVLHVYGNDKVLQLWQDCQVRVGEVVEEVICFHKVEAFQPFTIEDYLITPLPANHDKSEACLIYLIEQHGKRLLYCNDTGLLADATLHYLKGKRLDLLSLDCTHCRHSEGTNHMGFPDNLILIAQLKEREAVFAETQIVLTHFSHNGGMLHQELEALAGPHGFTVAYDGLAVVI